MQYVFLDMLMAGCHFLLDVRKGLLAVKERSGETHSVCTATAFLRAEDGLLTCSVPFRVLQSCFAAKSSHIEADERKGL